MEERYLYISYNSNMNLKDCQWYENLGEIKKERGITCSARTLSLVRLARYSSPDGSGCYLLDFQSDTIELLDANYASHVMKLIPSVLRELKLRKLGIN